MTYLWVLLMVAMLGAGLAAAAQVWSSVAQRERERELLFIGEQFRRAIGSYYENTPHASKRYPQTLEDLLEDRRFAEPLRHLRKIYRDPISRSIDWGIVRGADQSIVGVYSQTAGAAMIRAIPATVTLSDKGYARWQFVYDPARHAVARTSSVVPASNAPSLPDAGIGLLPIESHVPDRSAPAATPPQLNVPSKSAQSAEKPNPCVAMRAADLAACAALAQDPKAFDVCRRSSNRRYGVCTQGGTPPNLVTQ